MKYLNLGCGRRFNIEWTNIDFVSTSEKVISCNLHDRIPFPDAYFDVVYHSHLLEHFSKANAEEFMRDCSRVLKPKGILRVVVPDLEQIARSYLTALEKASSGSQEWVANYEWILLEMYDQTVRTTPGGEASIYLSREKLINEEFVVKRWGTIAKRIIEFSRKKRKNHGLCMGQGSSYKRLLKHSYRFVRYPTYRRELLLKLILGQEYRTLQVGRFRQSGEVHQWMYDRYSLANLLQKCGLEDIRQRTATESYIPNWISFNLDTEPNGAVYRPDSLFMEAIKPIT